jgi:predicted enzyme related to lactoylglutathione lyase
VAIAAFFMALLPAYAQTAITFQNPSFESPVQAGVLPGWSSSSVQSFDAATCTSFVTPHLNRCLYLSSSAFISQTLAATYQAGQTYTLTVRAGWPSSRTLTMIFLRGSTTLQSKNVATVNADYSLTRTVTAADVGQPITIRLTGTDLGIDNVRLTMTPNQAPTAIALSNTVVNFNAAINSVVATLTGNDPNPDTALTYALVAGQGATNNAAFTIAGNQLRISQPPTQPTVYSIRIRATDPGGLFREQVFTLRTPNQAPATLTLSSSSFNENSPAGATVATLSTTDPDPADSHTYSLIPGAGSTDNTAFSIVGNTLRINYSANYEAQSSYSIRLRVTDSGGLFYEQVATLTVNDEPEPPTGVTLSSTNIPENTPAGGIVGGFSTVDEDIDDTHIYSLVAGWDDADNSAFSIVGNTLKINAAPAQSSYRIRVRSTDSSGLFYEQVFFLQATPPNLAPTDLRLSNTRIPENVPAGYPVGTFGTTDPNEFDSHTYSLVSGSGSADNGVFGINGVTLVINTSPDYETKNSYRIRVRTTDEGGLFFEKAFTITITNVQEPTDPESLPFQIYRTDRNALVIQGLTPGQSVTVPYANVSRRVRMRPNACGLFWFWHTQRFSLRGFGPNGSNAITIYDFQTPILTVSPLAYAESGYGSPCVNGALDNNLPWVNLPGGYRIIVRGYRWRSFLDPIDMAFIAGLPQRELTATDGVPRQRYGRANACGLVSMPNTGQYPNTGLGTFSLIVGRSQQGTYNWDALPVQPAPLCRRGVLYQPAP